MDKKPEVSVIIPVYNEEDHIEDCLNSLMGQSFPESRMEWIIVDGGSTDSTPDILERFREKGPFVILRNPGRTTPSSLNLAIRKARGKYIVRMDAHAVYQHDYIYRCISCLEKMEADNAGGVIRVHGTGTIGRAFAAVLSSPFGAGGARFRGTGQSGYVDTVPFGTWRRELFGRIGLFDEKLLRSEDNDMNQRILREGGRIYLDADICTDYFCRSSLKDVLLTALNNGNALFFTIRKDPGAMRLRHYMPCVFLVSLAGLGCGSVGAPACRYLLAAETASYLALDLCFSVKSIRTAPVTLWLYPVFHLTYGLGSVLGALGIKTY